MTTRLIGGFAVAATLAVWLLPSIIWYGCEAIWWDPLCWFVP